MQVYQIRRLRSDRQEKHPTSDLLSIWGWQYGLGARLNQSLTGRSDRRRYVKCKSSYRARSLTCGIGISENIREAYVFLCLNYNPGDEIFLIGFSRGAFTARSISSLIRAIGLLNKKGLVYLYQITQDWEHQEIPGWKSPYPPWPNQPNHNVNSEEYRRELLAQELTAFDIPIKACAVFDTVGSLGVPSIGLLPRFFTRSLSFVDTKVEPIIENAFQALGLDEKRKPYSPTIWEVPDGQENPKVLKQCWFPGVHSDIGGGYDDQELGNITLAWMIHQLEGMLEFDRSYILEQQSVTIKAVHESGQSLRDWGLGKSRGHHSPLFNNCLRAYPQFIQAILLAYREDSPLALQLL